MHGRLVDAECLVLWYQVVVYVFLFCCRLVASDIRVLGIAIPECRNLILF
jgi:hypothetical protein